MINRKISIRLFLIVALQVLIVVLGLSATGMAKTGYVSDELVITLRAGKSSDFKIADYLKTGTRLDILQEEGDYLKVRTQDGKEGWVLKRYITYELPKADVIADLTKRIESMKASMGDVESVFAERDKLLEENKRLKSEKEELEHDLASIERRELLYWFLAGAGVLFLGWLIGRSSRQKRFY